jgi:hypothetical protein
MAARCYRQRIRAMMTTEPVRAHHHHHYRPIIKVKTTHTHRATEYTPRANAMPP